MKFVFMNILIHNQTGYSRVLKLLYYDLKHFTPLEQLHDRQEKWKQVIYFLKQGDVML